MQRFTDTQPINADTPKILLVEENRFFAAVVQRRIEEELGFHVDRVTTAADGIVKINCCRNDYMVALLDVNLTDDSHSKTIQHATNHGLSSIILTDGIDEDFRSRLLCWSIADYILKDSEACVDLLLNAIRRIHRNSTIRTMVVEDSRSMREAVIRLLKAQLFQVESADNGAEALKILDRNPDIKLIVTDYDMPGMTGFELIKRIRKTYTHNDLAIIGMSSCNDPHLSAKLIKSGADDFVRKPFQVEEFHCRIGHSIQMLENIALIRDLSYKDPLTRLYNRRYFFEHAARFMKWADTRGQTVSVAMIDIDFFKKVNDTYGHDGGDHVLREISSLIRTAFQDDAIISRFGGEEFCVLFAHPPEAHALARFEQLCQSIENAKIYINDETINVTVSIGICTETSDIDPMLKLADSRLYTAKETGRNKVIGRPPRSTVRD